MKQEQNERVKRIEWVSLVVDLAVSSYFGGSIARVFLKARSFRSLTSKPGSPVRVESVEVRGGVDG